MEYHVEEYKPRHRGFNTALLPPTVYSTNFNSNENIENCVEVVNASNMKKSYAAVEIYCENNGITTLNGSKSIGLEETVMKSCDLHPGDKVQLKAISTQEIQAASKVEISHQENNGDQLNQKVGRQVINRMQSGHLILNQGTYFSIPASTENGDYKEFVFKVRSISPHGAPLKCTETTEIVFSDTLFSDKSTKTFEQIGGLDEVVMALRESIQFPIEFQTALEQLGLRGSYAVILHGPPGNGKTLLIRKLVNELGVPCYYINGPELVSKYVGEGERQLRETFQKAKQNSPSIIAIDEIDSFAGKRDSYTNEFGERMVGQLLTSMDGLDKRGNVFCVATTNRLDSLDTALRRPGRFDREIEIPLPNESARLEILKIHSKNVTLSNEISLQTWTKKTEGFSGADLAELVRQAALCCIRRVYRLNDDGHFIQVGDVCLSDQDFQKSYVMNAERVCAREGSDNLSKE